MTYKFCSLLVALASSCFLTLASSAIAAPIALQEACGKVPEFTLLKEENERFQGELKGSADIVRKFLGSGELGGRIEGERKKYYQTDPDVLALQKDAYFFYLVCVLLATSDQNPKEKFDQLVKAREAFVRTLPSAAAKRPPSAPQTTSVPQVSGSFDGNWTVTTKWKDCKNPGRRFPISVKAGLVSSTIARNMRGTIGENGLVKFNYAVADGKGYSWINFLEGDVRDRQGSGVARSLGEGTDCSGRFELTRN